MESTRGLLTTIPGIGTLPAAAPGDHGLGSAPATTSPPGKRSSGRRRPGNKHLQPILVEIAWAAVQHEGYLKSLYHRHVMKNGGYRSGTAKKATITVARPPNNGSFTYQPCARPGP